MLVFVLIMIVKITAIRFAKSTCKKYGARTIDKSLCSTSNPKSLKISQKNCRNGLIQKVFVRFFSELPPARTKCQTRRKSKYQSKYRTSLNVESNQKFDVINTELLGTKNESKKSKKSTEQDGMNEHVEGGKASKGSKEIKKNQAIASASSKPENGSEPDKVSDDKKGTNTVEASKKANKETKSSEDKLEGDFGKDALKTGPEIKDKEVGKHKAENSPGQDEKKKFIEGKEKMEWFDHSEVQSQKHASCREYAAGWLPCDQ